MLALVVLVLLAGAACDDGDGRLVDNVDAAAEIFDGNLPPCSDDDPCILMETSCGCGGDGFVLAVPASQEERVIASGTSFCSALVSVDISCYADAAVCDEGECKLHIPEDPSFP